MSRQLIAMRPLHPGVSGMARIDAGTALITAQGVGPGFAFIVMRDGRVYSAPLRPDASGRSARIDFRDGSINAALVADRREVVLTGLATGVSVSTADLLKQISKVHIFEKPDDDRNRQLDSPPQPSSQPPVRSPQPTARPKQVSRTSAQPERLDADAGHSAVASASDTGDMSSQSVHLTEERSLSNSVGAPSIDDNNAQAVSAADNTLPSNIGFQSNISSSSGEIDSVQAAFADNASPNNIGFQSPPSGSSGEIDSMQGASVADNALPSNIGFQSSPPGSYGADNSTQAVFAMDNILPNNAGFQPPSFDAFGDGSQGVFAADNASLDNTGFQQSPFDAFSKNDSAEAVFAEESALPNNAGFQPPSFDAFGKNDSAEAAFAEESALPNNAGSQPSSFDAFGDGSQGVFAADNASLDNAGLQQSPFDVFGKNDGAEAVFAGESALPNDNGFRHSSFDTSGADGSAQSVFVDISVPPKSGSPQQLRPDAFSAENNGAQDVFAANPTVLSGFDQFEFDPPDGDVYSDDHIRRLGGGLDENAPGLIDPSNIFHPRPERIYGSRRGVLRPPYPPNIWNPNEYVPPAPQIYPPDEDIPARPQPVEDEVFLPEPNAVYSNEDTTAVAVANFADATPKSQYEDDDDVMNKWSFDRYERDVNGDLDVFNESGLPIDEQAGASETFASGLPENGRQDRDPFDPGTIQNDSCCGQKMPGFAPFSVSMRQQPSNAGYPAQNTPWMNDATPVGIYANAFPRYWPNVDWQVFSLPSGSHYLRTQLGDRVMYAVAHSPSATPPPGIPPQARYIRSRNSVGYWMF